MSTDRQRPSRPYPATASKAATQDVLQRVADCLERLLVQLEHLEELQRHPPSRIVPVAVDVATAAKLCDVGRTLFYELLQQGNGPPVAKLGTRTVIRYRSLDAWVAQREGRRHD